MTTQPDRLRHLLDRARRGVLLPAEGEQLAELVGELEAAIEQAELDAEQQARHFRTICGERESYRQAWKYEQKRRATAEAEVVRLTAGQCVDSRRMCDLHHQQPVTGCPYPRCLAVRDQTPPEHLAAGTNAEDCPGCVGTNPPYPWICPGPTTT
ncbi:hypothetical protein OG909_24845 [Streptomyces sp. NBC_01754]|uniref:hypothetical protein n=1 Tax=Streptomyces sp. NBC_01754 TaxID=2975930 RepID=UPI002DDBD09C|nr:hypothetical protein [Streptomyces sp. NBC_01754]WSC95244.1 hypothetical protein OG909_24845 [Streptomyces sp. NBC_01754]